MGLQASQKSSLPSAMAFSAYSGRNRRYAIETGILRFFFIRSAM